MAGTPEKMVEYLLETRVDNTSNIDGKKKKMIYEICISQTLQIHLLYIC